MKKMLYIAVLGVCFASAKAQDSLQTYIRQAVQNNPETAELYNAYRAATAAAEGAGVLPDPELSLGFYPRPMEHIGGKQVMTFQLMQMLPWWGTLRAGREAKEWRAKAAYERLRQSGLGLAFQVRRQWYELWAVQERIKSLAENISLLKGIRQVALYEYKSATRMKGARLSDQMRLDAELARLEEQKTSLESQRELQRRQFNLLLHREETAVVHLPDNIRLQKLRETPWDEILRRSPQLSQTLAESNVYKAEAERAQRQGMPMIGVGVEYMLNKKRDAHAMGVMPEMNGMDMWMPMVKISLPIYRRKTTSAMRAAHLMRVSAEAAYSRQVDELRARYLSIAQREDDVLRKIALYKEQIHLLESTLELMKTEYANGQTTLTDILQTSRELLDYALKKQEAYALHAAIAAEMEQLTGENEIQPNIQ